MGIMSRAKRVARRIYRRIRPVPPVTTVQRNIWEQAAQGGEFRFHEKSEWRQTDRFMLQTRALFEHFGLSPVDYANAVVIDLGAGSKLRSKYFSRSTIIAIEPLADRFMREVKWCDLADAAEVYSLPAEERTKECVGRADLLISINVIDHCFDFEQVVANIRDYLKETIE